MKLLNLGCGQRHDKAWVNLDFVSADKDVIAHNLLKGIPFNDMEFDVVYHSHVLEHFSKTDGKGFIKECHRVLKPGGVIRIAVPDLEQIIKAYQEQMEKALDGDENASTNYDWIMLELYDQAVREQSGGEMLKYLSENKIPNEKFIINRIGVEALNIRDAFKNKKNEPASIELKKKKIIQKIFSFSVYKNKLKTLLLKKEKKRLVENTAYLVLGRFRKQGEVHLWMYDRYSLARLLKETGFGNIKQKDAFTSSIENWNSYNLESKDGVIYKPDSLFMEAIK